MPDQPGETTTETYTRVDDLAAAVQVPDAGILSRTVLNNDHVKVVAFGFSPGEGLSEHTASMAAQIFFIHGEADVSLGGDTCTAQPGTWIHMAPRLEHSITARTPVGMLLILLKGTS